MNASNSPPPPSPSATKQESFESLATSSGTVIDDCITGRRKRKRSKLPQLTAASTLTSATPRPKWKKPDPTLTAAKITRPCTECGKRFWSWKALFGHMRCHPERQWRGINPPPNFQKAATTASTAVAAPSLSPSSSPLKPGLTEEDREVAISLMMMAKGWVQAAPAGAIVCVEEPLEVEPLNCQFECSSCKKVFGSHQALGGHRASHKKVKGCFAMTRKEGEEDEEKNEQLDCSGMGVAATTAVGQGQHECGICLKIFSSGQALGGHKRCHWERGESSCASTTKGCGVDLNLPTPTYEEGLLLDLRLGI